MGGRVKPVDQTTFFSADTRGNCWAACIASILELPITDIPHFVADYGSDWWRQTKLWCEARGFWCDYPRIVKKADGSYCLYRHRKYGGLEKLDAEFIIVDGISPRGIGHAVIADAHKWAQIGFRYEQRGDENDGCRLWLAHDPHPSRAGILTFESAYAIVPT